MKKKEGLGASVTNLFSRTMKVKDAVKEISFFHK